MTSHVKVFSEVTVYADENTTSGARRWLHTALHLGLLYERFDSLDQDDIDHFIAQYQLSLLNLPSVPKTQCMAMHNVLGAFVFDILSLVWQTEDDWAIGGRRGKPWGLDGNRVILIRTIRT